MRLIISEKHFAAFNSILQRVHTVYKEHKNGTLQTTVKCHKPSI